MHLLTRVIELQTVATLLLIFIDCLFFICFHLQLLIYFICAKLYTLNYLNKMLISCSPNPAFGEISFKKLYLYHKNAYCFPL